MSARALDPPNPAHRIQPLDARMTQPMRIVDRHSHHEKARRATNQHQDKETA